MLSSLTVIPILSWETDQNGDSKGSIGDLARHTEASPVDNVLLELVLAKELHSLSKTSAAPPAALYPCMHVIPIFVHDLFAKLSGLSEDAPVATLAKASYVLGSVGIRPDESFSKQSVKSIVSYFSKLQGVKYFDLGSSDSANKQVIGHVWDHLKTQAKAFDIGRFQLDSFSQNKPHASELLHFLCDADAMCAPPPLTFELLFRSLTDSNRYVAPFLVKHSVSSVSMLADMRHHPDAISSLSLEISQVCKRPPVEQSIKLLRLANAAAACPLALPLRQRLSDFVDADASILTAIYRWLGVVRGICMPDRTHSLAVRLHSIS
jgi:hypothetical protein